jgi:DNA-directed RNA polymerase specialized sigma24 family protein
VSNRGLYARQDTKLPNVTESRQTIKIQLNSAMAKYQDNAEEGRQGIWDAIHLFARYGAESYKQQSLRLAGRGGDLISGFTLHAMEQVEAGKYSGPEPFDHWMEVVFRNYANDELSELTQEKTKKYVETPGRHSPDDSETEAGHVSSDDVSSEQKNLDSGGLRLSSWTDERLRQLDNSADLAYAQLLMQGLNQKQAAVRMEESVVTARKREQRIRTALDAMETVSLQAVAEDETHTRTQPRSPARL